MMISCIISCLEQQSLKWITNQCYLIFIVPYINLLDMFCQLVLINLSLHINFVEFVQVMGGKETS